MGTRQRVAVALVATTLAAVSAVVLVDRFVLEAEWWQVDQHTTAAPAPPLLDLGPPPGPVRESWRLDTPIRHSGLTPYDQVAQGLVDGQLVIASSQGLDVRDARTGDVRWHYYRVGWALLGWASADHRIVAYLERQGDRAERMLVGFDAASGRLLWRSLGDTPAATERGSLRWPAGSGVVLTTAPENRRRLRGRSLTTGAVRWRAVLPEGCTLPEAGAYASDATETLAVLSLDCSGTSRIAAFDPGTGHRLWERGFTTTDPPQVAVRGEVTEVAGGGALRLYDRAGKEIAARYGDDICGATLCPAAATGGAVTVVYRAGQGDVQRRMEAIDASSGRSLWQRDSPAYAGMISAADRLYALRPSLAPGLLPAGIDVIEPAAGTAATVPAPLVMPSAQAAQRPWMAAGGGLLYLAMPESAPEPTGGVRLLALRGAAAGFGAVPGDGPMELGNVPAGKWPDACALLRKAAPPEPAKPGAFRVHADYAAVDAIRLPHPVTCSFEPVSPLHQRADAATETPSVTVEWVAGSPDAAAALLASLRESQSVTRPVEAGDEAYELDSPTGGVIATRVDRYIVSVSAFQTPGLAVRLARSIAATLRAGRL